MHSPVAHIVGSACRCARLDEDTNEWCFSFADEMALRIASPWRLVSDGRIVLGWRDHRQLFGHSEPLDATAILANVVNSAVVETTEVDPVTGDLSITFSNGPRLQVFNDSCGYEGWQLFGPGSRTVVAQGGGNVQTLG